MRRYVLFVAAALIISGPALISHAQDAGPSAAQILDKVDEAVNGPKDQSYTSRLVLTDKDGNQKTRELLMLQKGREKRLVRFLSPADQRGIAFLSLPDNVQYVYLPAFGKVRRVSSSVKNSSFAGTDFTYEDLEAVRWSEKWNAAIVRHEQESTVLELTPRAGKATDYSRLLVWVRDDSFYPVRIEHFDRSGKLSKVMVRDGLRQVQGYWISMTTTMEDVRTKHRTEMTVSDIKLDAGIGDDRFTERYLTK
jgi:outer membrane lipoprotein-sorting protein